MFTNSAGYFCVQDRKAAFTNNSLTYGDTYQEAAFSLWEQLGIII